MTDFTILDGGSVLILTPISDEAKAFVENNIPEDVPTWCGGVVIEHSCAAELINAVYEDGFTVRLVS